MNTIHQALSSVNETVLNLSDHIAFGGILAAIAGWLPAVAALLSICWYGVRFVDWLERRKLRTQLVKQGKIAEALGVKAGDSDA